MRIWIVGVMMTLICGAGMAQEPGPRGVDIEVNFVDFRMADIDVLARERRLTCDALQELWQQGDARLLHAPRIRTKNVGEGK